MVLAADPGLKIIGRPPLHAEGRQGAFQSDPGALRKARAAIRRAGVRGADGGRARWPAGPRGARKVGPAGGAWPRPTSAVHRPLLSKRPLFLPVSTSPRQGHMHCGPSPPPPFASFYFAWRAARYINKHTATRMLSMGNEVIWSGEPRMSKMRVGGAVTVRHCRCGRAILLALALSCPCSAFL